MNPPTPRFFVLGHERVLLEERIVRAWGLEHMLASLLLALFLWGGLGTFGWFLLPESRDLIVAIAASLGASHLLLSLVYVWRRLATTEYVITDEALYARRGRLILTVASALLDRVTDLHVHTSLMGRLFGYSGLSIRTAGGGVWMPGLREPYRVRGTIQEARHALIARLLRESGRADPTAAAPTRDGTSDIQCPQCELVFGVARRRPLDVECPRCHEKGMIFEEATA